jgi:hypothetical protein
LAEKAPGQAGLIRADCGSRRAVVRFLWWRDAWEKSGMTRFYSVFLCGLCLLVLVAGCTADSDNDPPGPDCGLVDHLNGNWENDKHHTTLEISGQSLYSAAAPNQYVYGSIAIEDCTIIFTDDQGDTGCATPGRYEFDVSSKTLELIAIDEPCPVREDLFDGREFERVDSD